ncbi:hypothetical protein ACH40F_35750 [Streptomyces sp. NPDC020794]|uniref:hypothetical protein n=1 Tax=unclassified Streptomyces TaxID=2593676 RepID=UPI0036E8DDEF
MTSGRNMPVMAKAMAAVVRVAAEKLRILKTRSGTSGLVPDDTNKVTDVFAFDRKTQTIVRVSTTADGAQADGVSSAASLSGDGRRVAFVSAATNLVPGDTNGLADVFIGPRSWDKTDWPTSETDLRPRLWAPKKACSVPLPPPAPWQ